MKDKNKGILNKLKWFFFDTTDEETSNSKSSRLCLFGLRLLLCIELCVLGCLVYLIFPAEINSVIYKAKHNSFQPEYVTASGRNDETECLVMDHFKDQKLQYPAVYDEPSTDGYVICRVGAGECLEIIGDEIDGFIPVRVGKIKGYALNSEVLVRRKHSHHNTPSSRIYYQWDEEWKEKPVGDFSFSSTGCLPTSFAMALSEMVDATVTPYDLGVLLHDFKTFNGNSFGGGMLKGSAKVVNTIYGIDTAPINKDDAKGWLESDGLVLVSVGYSPWCTVQKSYHCILLKGYSEDGKTYIKDPTRLPSDISDVWYDLDEVLKYANEIVVFKPLNNF